MVSICWYFNYELLIILSYWTLLGLCCEILMKMHLIEQPIIINTSNKVFGCHTLFVYFSIAMLCSFWLKVPCQLSDWEDFSSEFHGKEKSFPEMKRGMPPSRCSMKVVPFLHASSGCPTLRKGKNDYATFLIPISPSLSSNLPPSECHFWSHILPGACV